MAPKLLLTYKRDFDPNFGEKQKVSMTSTIQTADGVERLHTTSRQVRVFMGKTPEDLCFTRECFKQAVDDISIKSRDLKEKFITVLALN